MGWQSAFNLPFGTRQIHPAVQKRTSGSDEVVFSFEDPVSNELCERRVNVVMNFQNSAVLEIPAEVTEVRVVSDHIDVLVELDADVYCHALVIDKLTSGPNDLSLNRVHVYTVTPVSLGSLYVINFTDKVARVTLTGFNWDVSFDLAVSAGHEFVNPMGLVLRDRENLLDWALLDETFGGFQLEVEQLIGDPPEWTLVFSNTVNWTSDEKAAVLVLTPPQRSTTSLIVGASTKSLFFTTARHWQWQYFAPALE